MVKKILLVLLATLLTGVAAVLFYEPLTYSLVKASAVPPDVNFVAKVFPAEGAYTIPFTSFPSMPECEVWINGAGNVVQLKEPGGYHAGQYLIEDGSAVHIVGNDIDFANESKQETYNNVALFCGLPRPEDGQKLVAEIPMEVINLAGSSGAYFEAPAINAEGKLNPGGFNAVGLSLGGKDIQARIGNGIHLHEIWGWSPIQGVRDPNTNYSGVYRLELLFMPSGHQFIAMFHDGVEVGRFQLEHPFGDNIELQIWLDNYETPVYLFPFGHANVTTPEELRVSEIKISVEPIVK